MNDKTITIYNRHRTADKKDIWNRTVINGVEYHFSSDKTVSQNGTIVYTQLLTVVIPAEADTCGKTYIDAVDYMKLPENEVNKYFSFNVSNNLDVIVAGECDKEITAEYKITELQKDIQKSGTIASFSDNTDGALLKHYKVVCKCGKI